MLAENASVMRSDQIRAVARLLRICKLLASCNDRSSIVYRQLEVDLKVEASVYITTVIFLHKVTSKQGAQRHTPEAAAKQRAFASSASANYKTQKK